MAGAPENAGITSQESQELQELHRNSVNSDVFPVIPVLHAFPCTGYDIWGIKWSRGR